MPSFPLNVYESYIACLLSWELYIFLAMENNTVLRLYNYYSTLCNQWVTLAAIVSWHFPSLVGNLGNEVYNIVHE